MALMTRGFKSSLKRYQTGIFLGIGFGLFAAWYMINQGVDLQAIARSGNGLIDSAMSRTAPVQIVKTKIYLMLAFLGAMIGYYADMIVNRIK